MRILVKVFGVIVVLAIAGLLVLLFTDFNSPRMAQALVRLAAERGGIDLQVDHVTFNLRRGVLLEGVKMRSEAEGDTVDAAVDRLVLEHRLWPLLRGRVVVERLIVERPVIEMTSVEPDIGLEAPTEAAAEPAAGASSADESQAKPSSRLDLEIGEVVLRQGRWTSRSQGGAGSTVIDGLELTLRDIVVDSSAGTLLLALSGEGWIEIADLGLDDRRLTDIATSIAVDRGRYRLAEFRTEAPAGRLTIAELEIDLSQTPYRYRFDIDAESLDLARVLGVEDSLGMAQLELRGNGEGPGLEGAVAEISLEVEAGSLPSVEVLARVDRLIGTQLDGAAHDPVDLQVALAGGVLEVDPFEIITEIARLRLSGSIAPGGIIDLRLRVGLPRDLFDRSEVSDEVLDVLTDQQQWLTIPLRVSGTTSEPRFGPDMDFIREATRYLAEGAKESVRQRFRSELGGTIGRRLGR